ncbi:unnamed protein product [Lymnaea stagnalis]|uniref:RING-type domain-containing protein n=1 Tax=Lymnaea stagnalis TaxID=6523 RepID=A0AAV2GZA3_LYMST
MEEKENEPPEDCLPVTLYNKQLSKGSCAYHSMKYVNAAEFFHNALDLISKHGKEALNVKDDDLSLLNFVYAMACIHTPSIHNLQNAIDRFISIGQGDTFPAAYYGLGLVYLTLHRYKDAIDQLNKGLESITNYEGKCYLWPQTNRVIDETDPTKLRNLLTEKLKQCHSPARPDALCTFHLDTEITRREIYKLIPDYKGSITLKCSAKCILEFHTTCWKLYKQNIADKHSDKEMLDIKCPTPCCWGFTCAVTINKPGQEPKHLLSTSNEKPMHIPRPMIKAKTDNPQKLLKRAQKKRDRKEKKNERKLLAAQKEAASVDQEDTDVPVKHVPTEDQSQLHGPDCQVTILKKDEPDLIMGTKHKSTKVKKKKEKVKHFLPVDVQFKDDQDRKRVSAFTMDEEDVEEDPVRDSSVSGSSVSGSLPLPGIDLNTSGSQGAALSRDNLQELYLFFGQIVKSERILDLNGPLVRDTLRSLPPEAIQHIDSVGGIVGFLRMNPNFNVLRNNFVNLNSTADKPAAAQPNPGASKPAAVQPKPQFSWENRKKSMEAAAAAAKTRSEPPGQGVWNLNPAAKEFFPPPTSQSHKGSYNELDTFELPKSSTRSSENDLPAAAAVDNEGFTKVTSKKNAGQTLKASAFDCSIYDFFDGSSTAGQKSSYDTLDAITLGQPKKSKASSIDMLDEDDFASSQSDKISVARSMESDDRSDLYNTGSSQGRRDGKRVPDLTSDFDTRRQRFQVPQTRRSSDASDVSGEGSGSQASSITSSCSTDRRSRDQAAAPVPLKAPMISLPSRGKKKGVRPLLANCYKPVSIVQGKKRTPSADSSVTTSSAAADDDDLESLASTHSDLASEHARQSPGLVNMQRSNAASSASGFLKPRGVDQVYQSEFFSYETSTPKAPEPRKVVNRNLFDSESSRNTPSQFLSKMDMDGLTDGDGGSQQLREQPLSQGNVDTQTSLNQNPFTLYRDSVSSDRSLPSGLWSGNDDQLKDFFPSFTHNPSVPDMGDVHPADTDSLRIRQSSESRVLKQLASRTNVSSQEPFSLPTTTTNTLSNHESVYNIWKAVDSDSCPKTPTWNTDLSGGLADFNLESFERRIADPEMVRCSSTPQDPMDRPVLACKGPWIPPPDIPITNSPLLQPSSIAPLDTSSMGWMLSGLKSSLDSPLTTSDMDLPQRDYQLNLDSTGFSRTPGKRNPFSVSSMRSDEFSLSNDVFSSRAKLSADSEPFFPPSYLDQSFGHNGHSRLGFTDDFTQTTPARQVTEGSQTEKTKEVLVTELKTTSLLSKEEDVYKNRIRQLEQEKSEAVSRADASERRRTGFELLYERTKQENDQLREKMVGADRKNQSLELDFNTEREKRMSAERKVLTLAMELSLKTMEFKRMEASIHVQKLGAALKKINPSEDIYLDLQSKQGEWTDYMKICERKMEEIWNTYQKKIKEFNTRGSVDDLELLSTVPPPPPSPPSLEKIQVSFSLIKTSPDSSTKDSEDDAQALIDMIYSGDGNDSGTTSPDNNNALPSHNGGHALGGGRKSPPASVGSNSDSGNSSQPPSDAYPAVKKGLLPTPLVPQIPKLMGNPFQKPMANYQHRQVASPLHKPMENSRLSPKPSMPLRNLNPIKPKGMPPRPLKPTGGVLPRPAAAMVPPQVQTSFEKIVIAIQEMFPNYPRNQVQRIIDGLRKENGGSLSGFNEEILTRHIAEKIIEEDGVESSGHTAFTPEELVTKKGPRSVTDSQCTICYELINYPDAETLDCHHKFHLKCIKKWFAENRSCPNCRTFVLPQDEFPSLHQHRYL